MKLIPTQYFLVIRICDVKADSKIITVSGEAPKVMPFGEVLAAGPDCKFCSAGDKVLFNLENLTIGFESLKQFVIAEGSVFAKLELEGEDATNVVDMEMTLRDLTDRQRDLLVRRGRKQLHYWEGRPQVLKPTGIDGWFNIGFNEGVKAVLDILLTPKDGKK